MEKQYKLNDLVSKDSLKSPIFKKWLKRILCAVCIISLAFQLTLCCLPMQASAQEDDSALGTWVLNTSLSNSGTSSSLLFHVDISFLSIQFDQFFVPSNVSVAPAVQFSRESGGAYGAYFYINNNNLALSAGSVRYQTPDGTVNVDANVQNRTFEITGGVDVTNAQLISWLSSNAVKMVTNVYDFTGEHRLFNEQLTNLSFSQAGTVTQSYAFDFNIWGGYNADYFHVQADGSSVDISYAFTDVGSGGIKTVYRQLLRDGEIVGTWLVPRARLIYFQSNPDNPTFQQWLLDNTVLIDESMIESVYSFGYDNGYNDGWTNSAIGDTLKAPVEALNNVILLDIAGVTITLGGVIFTMIVLSIMLIFLKKYAGG